MNSPLVSICIPTYNGERYITQCIESAISQTYANTEILVVDDGSIDNTCKIIEGFAATNSKIKLMRNEKNLGLVGNWNRCIELAKGEWIKFLFQDDYFDNDCVEAMMSGLSAEDKLVTSDRRLVFGPDVDEATKTYSLNETLTFTRLGFHARNPVFISPEKISSLTAGNISMNFIGEPTVVMFKKDVVKELGEFNSDLIQICDLEYFLRIASIYGLKYIPRELTYFRVHKGSASSSNISERSFSMTYIDPIVMAYLLLHSRYYGKFRGFVTTLEKIKLKLFFDFRVNEAYKASQAANTSAVNRQKFETISTKYPHIGQNKNGSLLTALILPLVKLKRIINR
ncbi:MAG TPA: glycosyltransferase [Bacteroidia bacterium]|nr:glycosyltransferase [Bacteroidia bacterium]